MSIIASTETLAPNKSTGDSLAKRPFLTYIHNFRAIAILFIVALHCYSILKSGAEPAIIKRGTLLFMFISGFLLQYLSGKFNKTTYWRNKLSYVITPYLIVSTPVIFARVLAQSHSDDILSLFPGFPHQPLVVQIISYYLTGLHLVPLWFIPMICFYYLLAPVFVYLDRDGRIYYLLPAFIALSLYITRSQEVYRIHLAFIHYLSVYMLGMFVSRHCTKVLQVTNSIWPLLLLLTFTSIIAGIIFNKEQIIYFEQFLYIQKLLLCWTFIYVFWKTEKYIPQRLGEISDMSFGVFFLHYYLLFIITIGEYKGYVHFQNNFVTFLFLFVVDITFCVVILKIMKKVFGKKSRYLIGY